MTPNTTISRIELIPKIIREVYKHYNKSVADLFVKSRKLYYSEPRQVCIYFLCEIAGIKFSDIAILLGGRYSRSNMFCAHRTIKEWVEVDKGYAKEIESLKLKITENEVNRK